MPPSVSRATKILSRHDSYTSTEPNYKARASQHTANPCVKSAVDPDSVMGHSLRFQGRNVVMVRLRGCKGAGLP